MAVALQSFINQLANNSFRTSNMFEMYVTSGFSDVDAVLKNITLYGEGFELPERNTQFAEVSFKGQAFPIQTNQTMGNEHTIQVRADINGEIRRAFLAWQAKNWNPDFEGGSVLEGDRNLNTGSIIRIHLLNSTMDGISEIYKMIGIKVGNIGGLTMSNTDANVNTFSVSFRSLFWTIEKGTVEKGAFPEQV